MLNNIPRFITIIVRVNIIFQYSVIDKLELLVRVNSRTPREMYHALNPNIKFYNLIIIIMYK